MSNPAETQNHPIKTDPGGPARQGEGLREFLWRWIAPAVRM